MNIVHARPNRRGEPRAFEPRASEIILGKRFAVCANALALEERATGPITEEYLVAGDVADAPVQWCGNRGPEGQLSMAVDSWHDGNSSS